MKKSSTSNCGTLIFSLAILLLPCQAQADFITPTGVASSSFYSYTVHPLNLINNTAVTSASSSIAVNTGFWHSAAAAAGGANTYGNGGPTGGFPVVANQSLIFTLPGTYDLTQADLWQMNQTGQFPRGTNQFDLLVSSDGVNYIPAITNANLAVATGAVTGQVFPFAQQSNVRFVKLQIDTAHSGNANEFVGLNEVRFEGTLVQAGPVLTVGAAATSAGLAQQPSSLDFLQGKVGTATLTTGTMAMLTDGTGTNDLAHRVIFTDGNVVRQITYDATALGLGANEVLNINKINVFGYNTDARRVHDYDVAYTLDGVNWEYAFIGAANGTVGNGVTLSSLARADSLDFLTGVRGLRFDFRPIQGNLQSSLIEIDVFGAPAVIPEPSTLALVLCGGLVCYTLRSRRKSQVS